MVHRGLLEGSIIVSRMHLCPRVRIGANTFSDLPHPCFMRVLRRREERRSLLRERGSDIPL